MKPVFKSFIILIMCCLVTAWLLPGCAFQKRNPQIVRIAGARDVLPLAEKAASVFNEQTSLSLELLPSANALEDLKTGKADVALVGWDPAEGEMQGLQEHVVAYDAVCLLVSLRAYNGGHAEGSVNNGQALLPMATLKGGFKNISSKDLKDFYRFKLGDRDYHYWKYPVTYLVYRSAKGEVGEFRVDPEEKIVLGTWEWKPLPLRGEFFQPGKYDTQTVIFQQLGLSLTDLQRPDVKLDFVPKYFDSEEELISWRFEIDPMQAKEVSGRDFNFYILMASRQVTVRAIEHEFSLRPLAVDGIDPLEDVEAVYRGEYPFARRIRLLTIAQARPEVRSFVEFLLSPQGQRLIADARFLPLPTDQVVSQP